MRRMRRADAARIGTIVVAATVVACGGTRRPPVTLDVLDADGVLGREARRAAVARILDGLAERAVVRGDRTLDLLLLSGGGQHGAYGIGFLRGWRTRAVDPMPRFDLVTGISTGALQAPFALLGTEAALDTAAALYRDAERRVAPTVDLLYWLRGTGGIVDASRLRATLRTVADERFCDRLRAEFSSGRRIAIATTDLDLGVGRVWDLAAELTAPGATAERMHDLLMAAAAIPGIFPPLVVDGHVHVDGGVIANVLPVLDFADYQALAERLRDRGVTDPVTVRLWVVMNLWTHPPSMIVDPGHHRQISTRALTLLFWSQQPQLLDHLADVARAVTSGIPGLRMEVRHTAVPSDLAGAPGSQALFDREWMLRLEALGYERARGAEPWDTVTSPYDRPLRPPRPSSQ
jgi:hypothetical protein